MSSVKLIYKKGTAEAWSRTTRALFLDGVLIHECDTGRFKLSDALRRYSELPYLDVKMGHLVYRLWRVLKWNSSFCGFFSSKEHLPPASVSDGHSAIVLTQNSADMYTCYQHNMWCLQDQWKMPESLEDPMFASLLTEEERRLAALGGPGTLQYCGSDGQKWAECFVATLKDKNLDATDVGWMTAWFANAIVHSQDRDLWTARRFTKSDLLGALVSFVAHLSKLKKNIAVGERYEATPVIAELAAWADMRGLKLNDPDQVPNPNWDQYLVRKIELRTTLAAQLKAVKDTLQKLHLSSSEFDRVADSFDLPDAAEEKSTTEDKVVGRVDDSLENQPAETQLPLSQHPTPPDGAIQLIALKEYDTRNELVSDGVFRPGCTEYLFYLTKNLNVSDTARVLADGRVDTLYIKVETDDIGSSSEIFAISTPVSFKYVQLPNSDDAEINTELEYVLSSAEVTITGTPSAILARLSVPAHLKIKFFSRVNLDTGIISGMGSIGSWTIHATADAERFFRKFSISLLGYRPILFTTK